MVTVRSGNSINNFLLPPLQQARMALPFSQHRSGKAVPPVPFSCPDGGAAFRHPATRRLLTEPLQVYGYWPTSP